MKRLIEVEEEREGLEALLNENVLIWCVNYIYAGKLVGVNDKFIKLDDAKIVYETGPLDQTGYKDAQFVPRKTQYIQCSAIESYGYGK